MTQYAVAWRADSTQIVNLVGPFKSLEVAQKVVDRIEKLEAKAEALDELNFCSLSPEIVMLDSLSVALSDVRESVGLVND